MKTARKATIMTSGSIVRALFQLIFGIIVAGSPGPVKTGQVLFVFLYCSRNMEALFYWSIVTDNKVYECR